MRPLEGVLLFVLLLLLALVEMALAKTGSYPPRDVFVHTFDTREMCMVRCRLACSQQHSEDLMMPRWYCPLQEESEGAWETEERGDTTSLLIVIIPVSILGAALLLCALAACTSRVLRSS